MKGIKADLVRGNDGWKDWNFKELLKELKRWSDINPVEETAAERGPSKGNQNWAHKQTSCPSFYNAQSRPEINVFIATGTTKRKIAQP